MQKKPWMPSKLKTRKRRKLLQVNSSQSSNALATRSEVPSMMSAMSTCMPRAPPPSSSRTLERVNRKCTKRSSQQSSRLSQPSPRPNLSLASSRMMLWKTAAHSFSLAARPLLQLRLVLCPTRACLCKQRRRLSKPQTRPPALRVAAPSLGLLLPSTSANRLLVSLTCLPATCAARYGRSASPSRATRALGVIRLRQPCPTRRRPLPRSVVCCARS
mmetsp:Transcript_4838/g.9829  ORF Transcript_4838/g.9829 Transcript_4838/m.9829 type:complete len:216 (-) Transcript_4838:672-1319(-)